jgi:hypothetical protein
LRRLSGGLPKFIYVKFIYLCKPGSL